MAGVLPPWFDPEVGVLIGGTAVPELGVVSRHAVDDDFFRVLEIAVREGRAFGSSDVAGGAPVMVVSRSVARALAGGDGGGALGRSVRIARAGQPVGDPIQVVGIADDVQYNGPRATTRARHDIYLPISQAPGSVLSFAVATDRDPAVLLGGLRRTLSRLAPTSPLHWISTMEEELAGQYRDARLYAWLTIVFGGSALLLVTIGIYGVMSSAVSRRLPELGVRIAVGARPLDIILLVLRQASRPMLVGIAAGTVATLANASLVASLVYGVTPTEPSVYAGVGVAIVIVGLLACWLPALRATRIDAKRLLQGS
jgi:hypothetical protein